MKKRSGFIASILFIMLVSGCKKQNDELPAFNPVGYWRGNSHVYHAAILNESNGVSRLYYGIQGFDTTQCSIKGVGTYTICNGLLFARYRYADITDSMYVEAITVSNSEISGFMMSTNSFETAPFVFRRQP